MRFVKKNERNNEGKAQQTHHTEIERSGSGSAAQYIDNNSKITNNTV